MCRAMNSITGSSYAVTGAAWDLEKVLTLGAYGDAGYFSSALVEENGKELIMTGGSTQAYKQVLALEYEWATTGVISKDGKPGPISEKLYTKLRNIQYGIEPDTHNWITVID